MTATGQVVLVLGGARSGKSALAERLLAASASKAGLSVSYVATGPAPDASDPEWCERVAQHRARRPVAWATVEPATGDELPGLLRALDGAVLVDSLGSWVAGFDGFDAPAEVLVAALGDRSDRGLPTVVVSEEVGLGVHPPTEAGRRFADALGELNQAVSSTASTVLLAVAGRAVELAPPTASVASVEAGA